MCDKLRISQLPGSGPGPNVLEKAKVALSKGARIFRPQIDEVACVSRSGCKRVVRLGELLSSADQMQVVLIIRWPIWWAKEARRVVTRVIVDPEEGRSGILGLSDASKKAVPMGQCRVKQATLGRRSRVRIELPAVTVRKCSVLLLEIFGAGSRQPLRNLRVRILTPHEIKKEIISSLEADSVRLWIEGGGRYYPGSQVPLSSQCLIPELRIPGCLLAAFAPPVAEVLTWRLISETGAITFGQQEIRPHVGPQKLRGPTVWVQNKHLIGGPGNHSIEIKIANRDLTCVRFQVLAEREVLRHVRVSNIRIEAEKRDGQVVAGLNTLRWEEHRAFRPILQIETGVPAPRNLAWLVVRILRGTTVLWRQDFLQPLDRSIRHIKMQSMDLHTLGLRVEPRPARLSVSVCYGGEVQCSAPILVLPPERITNFEGQLNFDAQELPLDETEYSQIVQRLGLATEAPRLGRLGKWWQKLRIRPTERPASMSNDGLN